MLKKLPRMSLWNTDIPGGASLDGNAPTLDPFILEGRTTGVIVVCPGGGYAQRAPHEGAPIAQWLNANGISVVVCNYRVSPHHHPFPLIDVKRAVRTVRANAKEWNIDPAHVGALGFSAGGHLVSTLATHWHYHENVETTDSIDALSARPDTIILCYAVVSLVEPFGHTGSMKNLLGENVTEDMKLFLSNEKHVRADTPPAFLWHTSDDPGVPLDNSLVFASALRKNNIPCELHAYESGKHGLGLAKDIPDVGDWTTQCIRWLKRRGW
ncbi:MAG: alpha/beta hydrolase [Spirochaetota bacterium]